MATTEKKVDLIDYENEELRVYDLNEVRPLFEDRMDMPSGRVFQGKSGKRALGGLQYIEEHCNQSWYQCIKDRWADYPDREAIFYRGNVITAAQMFERADRFARALVASGIVKGDEIPCCISNVPELLYIMLGANKVGAKLNFFGSHYDPVFIHQIMTEACPKLFLASDDEYEKIAELVEKIGFGKIVLISLADSLPEHPEQCEGYEPSLDRYYHYENRALPFIAKSENVVSFAEFLEDGESFPYEVRDTGDLDTEFLVTYTSGSTKIGFPKRMIHRNRSLITIGVFHDPKWCGNPAVKWLRNMAHIHTDSNTNLITSYSDSLFQNWSVAPEPEYGREIFLDYLFVDKPNFTLATTSFLLRAARQYLIEGKYHDEEGRGRKLDFLMVVMAVGEACQPGEEAFINEFLKQSRAGSAVNLFGPLHFPYVTVGNGGGDTEHGGIYYTLWRSLTETLNKPKLHGQRYGLKPVPYAQVTCLRKTADGSYVECGYNEYGIIVANSATTMKRYRDFSKVPGKIVTDEHGVDWVNCDIFGCIDHLGCVHVKDRADSAVVLEDGNRVLPFRIVDEVQKDPRNILSTVVTTCEVEGKTRLVVNIEFSPLKTHSELQIVQEMDERIHHAFPELSGKLLYRKFDNEHQFPLTGSGKRSVVGVQTLGEVNAYRFCRGKMLPAK